LPPGLKKIYREEAHGFSGKKKRRAFRRPEHRGKGPGKKGGGGEDGENDGGGNCGFCSQNLPAEKAGVFPLGQKKTRKNGGLRALASKGGQGEKKKKAVFSRQLTHTKAYCGTLWKTAGGGGVCPEPGELRNIISYENSGLQKRGKREPCAFPGAGDFYQQRRGEIP